MAEIINVESLGFDEIRADIEKFLSTKGDIVLSDFHESSIGRRFTSVMAAIYNQLFLKLNSVRQESMIHSALEPESIKYLAQSQLAYHPKRKIAPQHPVNIEFTFKAAKNAIDNVNEDFNRYAVLGDLSVNGINYPISIIDAKTFRIDEKSGLVKCRLGIGTWREVTIAIDERLGHLEPYHVFHIDEEKDVIDDSGTVHIALVGTKSDKEPEVINNLYDISNLREIEKRHRVLVTSNHYGGLDVNFGDGIIFGNLLYNENMHEQGDFGQSLNKFTVWYFVTPGFIPNLNFVSEKVSWDTNFVDGEWFDERWTEETASRHFREWWNTEGLDEEEREKIEEDKKKVLKSLVDHSRFNSKMANGINEESIDQIKTLAPYVALSNNRIMNNTDFITRVRRIPQIKSCASRSRHLNPGDMGDATVRSEAGVVLPLVPTATFELTGLTYRFPSDVVEVETWEPPYKSEGKITGYQDFAQGTVIKWGTKEVIQPDGETTEVDKYWLLDARVFQTNDGARYVYTNESGKPEEKPFYYIDDNRITKHEVKIWYEWQPEEKDFYIGTETEAIFIWKELEENEIEFYTKTTYQPLTQMEWDLNYHTQYNFDSLLSFMQVRVLPPIEQMVDFDITVILKQNLDIHARTQFEIDRLIKKIIYDYCWELGVFLDVGKIVSDILRIDEVLQCYLHSPLANKQYATMQYVKPVLSIKYQKTSLVDNKFSL